MYIKVFKQLNKNSVSEAGGKGSSLGEMTNAKIPVPPGFVVLAKAFDQFLQETDLDSEIRKVFPTFASNLHFPSDRSDSGMLPTCPGRGF